MHILLTNDDGISAPGLMAIYKQLTTIADVTVVAPNQVRSGASHSVTLTPIICKEFTVDGLFTGYSVDGSPADCVKLAMMEIIDRKAKPVDLVVSGMNYGANTGVYVHYSGTVAAAREAAFCGVPAIAISAAYHDDLDFDEAAQAGFDVIKKLLPLKGKDIITINIPDITSNGKPKGVKVIPNSTNCYDEKYSSTTCEKGHTTYQYLGGPHTDEPGAMADTIALHEGYITVTALHVEVTDLERNKELSEIIFNK
jgi:5'-nucleotidase